MQYFIHKSLPTLNGCYFPFTFLNPFLASLEYEICKFCFLWNSQLSQKACPGYNLQSWDNVSQSGLFRNMDSFFLPFFSTLIHFSLWFLWLILRIIFTILHPRSKNCTFLPPLIEQQLPWSCWWFYNPEFIAYWSEQGDNETSISKNIWDYNRTFGDELCRETMKRG